MYVPIRRRGIARALNGSFWKLTFQMFRLVFKNIVFTKHCIRDCEQVIQNKTVRNKHIYKQRREQINVKSVLPVNIIIIFVWVWLKNLLIG